MSSDPQWFIDRAKALAEGDTWPRTKEEAQPESPLSPPNEIDPLCPQEPSPQQPVS